MYSDISCHAVIAAGGIGSRFAADASGAPKQFAVLSGKTILARTVELFEKNAYVDEIYIVIHPEFIDTCREITERNRYGKVCAIIPGGSDRQKSVFAGLSQIKNRGSLVVIHDAARPLTPQRVLNGCIYAACRYGAAVAAVPAKDAIKTASDSFITGTPDRNLLYHAQTPQAFRFGLIYDAHSRAEADGFTARDDAELLERLGIPVRIVEGSFENIKITTPEDLRLAEYILN